MRGRVRNNRQENSGRWIGLEKVREGDRVIKRKTERESTDGLL